LLVLNKPFKKIGKAMSKNTPIRPEDILPDGIDSTSINGKLIRKGTIAAFLTNIDILENPLATKIQKQGAIETMKELAPAVIAIGLHKQVIFKNYEAEHILVDAE
jgi:hypothetical protein